VTSVGCCGRIVYVLVSEPGPNPARTADVDNEPVRWGLEIKHVTALSHHRVSSVNCHQSDEPRAVIGRYAVLWGPLVGGCQTNRPLPRGGSSRPMVARLVRYGPVRQRKLWGSFVNSETRHRLKTCNQISEKLWGTFLISHSQDHFPSRVPSAQHSQRRSIRAHRASVRPLHAHTAPPSHTPHRSDRVRSLVGAFFH
jgi:hypothetical protein